MTRVAVSPQEAFDAHERSLLALLRLARTQTAAIAALRRDVADLKREVAQLKPRSQPLGRLDPD